MNGSRITRKVFEYDLKLCKDNWSSQMQNVFMNVGHIDTFQDKRTVGDIKEFENANRAKWINEWKNALRTKPKLRTYILFKEEFGNEDYVKYCMSHFQRSLIAQIGCGILPLRIEIGRFRGEKLEERLCQICHSHEIEDEIHFVTVCNAYEIYRQQLYESITDEHFTSLGDKDKFVYLLKNEWKLFSVYVEKAWNMRTSILYK